MEYKHESSCSQDFKLIKIVITKIKLRRKMVTTQRMCMDKAFFYVQAAQDLEENGDIRKVWKELCCRYEDISENDLIALMTEFKMCRMKIARNDPTLWYAELDHTHQCMQKAGVKEKSDTEMIAQIMTHISEGYKVATQAICIMHAAKEC